MLSKAKEYLDHANEALALLAREPDRESQTILLHMAETWLRLAEAATDHHSRTTPPEPTPIATAGPAELPGAEAVPPVAAH
jgi:hypothetical protein